MARFAVGLRDRGRVEEASQVDAHAYQDHVHGEAAVFVPAARQVECDLVAVQGGADVGEK